MAAVNPLADLLARAQNEYGPEPWLMELAQQLVDAQKRAVMNGLSAASGLVAGIEADIQADKLEKPDESIGSAKIGLDRYAKAFPGEAGFDQFLVRLQNLEDRVRVRQSAGKQFEKAIACLQKGDLDGAKALLDMIVSRSPDSLHFDEAFALTRLIDALPPRLAAIVAAMNACDAVRARELLAALKADVPQLNTMAEYERKIGVLETKIGEIESLAVDGARLVGQD